MRGMMLSVFMVFASFAAFGQAKGHKAAPAQPSHKAQVLFRLDIAEVQYRVSCARTADRAANEQCVNQMLRDLQATFRRLALQDVPIPKKMQTTEVVLVFKEEVLLDNDTLTLTVYETENNDEVYSDSRSVLILKNDMTKLISSYVDYLDSLDSGMKDSKD